MQYLEDGLANIEDWNVWLDGFVSTFDTKLQDTVRDKIQDLYDSGKLAELTAQVIDVVQDQIDDLDSKIDTQVGDVNSKIDNQINDVHGKINDANKDLDNYIATNEIEPDDLREDEFESDGTLLQRAFDLVNADERKTKSIKLGRIYNIEKTINVGATISQKHQSWLLIRGSNGGLKLSHDGYMFDGDRNGGGLLFDKVKFEGSDEFIHPLVNGTNLIQITFDSCQFFSTNTIIDSTNYLQTIRFINNNFKGMQNYQIIAPMAYDMRLLNNVVEWGYGGFLHLTQTSSTGYADFGLYVQNNLIEGISGQIPIKTTQLIKAVFDSNYFEGNNYTDIDLTGGAIPHMGLTITNNAFGNYPEPKNASVKVGRLYSRLPYNFSNNTGSKMVFDFSESQNATLIDLSGGDRLSGGQPNYFGTSDAQIGSYADKHEFNGVKPKYFEDTKHEAHTEHTCIFTLPEKGTYIVTVAAFFNGDPTQAIHETILLVNEGSRTTYSDGFRKITSMSKGYINLDQETNDLSYSFPGIFSIAVKFTHSSSTETVISGTYTQLNPSVIQG